MNDVQRVAWLVAVGRQSMSGRGVEALDGEAVDAVLAAAGVDHRALAATAILQLAEVAI